MRAILYQNVITYSNCHKIVQIRSQRLFLSSPSARLYHDWIGNQKEERFFEINTIDRERFVEIPSLGKGEEEKI